MKEVWEKGELVKHLAKALLNFQKQVMTQKLEMSFAGRFATRVSIHPPNPLGLHHLSIAVVDPDESLTDLD